MKNDAFISYSRKDIQFASGLEKALEAYRPPKGISEQSRNLIIFRDVEDFTGVEYHHSLKEHLENSAKLIVLCSPHARQSPYVNDEIERFAQYRGANNIIPILVSGLANNEAKPGQENQIAFPDTLCQLMAMPLAVDYRDFDLKKEKINKGVYYGQWYTLLANLYDVSRRDIEQRDKKRRTRRRTTGMAITSAVIIALTGLLIFALISRRLADNQRKIAMKALYDLTYELPKQLRQLPGSLEVRLKVAELNTTTLQRLRGLTPDELRVVRELATNHRLWGGFLLEAGDQRRAYKKFKDSAKYTHQLVNAKPDDPLWQRDLAVSYYNAGLVQERLGETTLACREYQNAAKPAIAAASLQSDEAKFQRLLQNVENKISQCR
jgi:hypothetical protein